MNLEQSVRSCFSQWITIDGRATRSEYWWFQLFCFLATVVMGVLVELLPLIAIVIVPISIYLAIAQLAVSIRRLHDTNKTGWWILIGIVPFVGGLILFFFFVLPSDIGPNDFGN